MSIVTKIGLVTSTLTNCIRTPIGVVSNSRWVYTFDGVDDYVKLAASIPLFVGDVVEFDYMQPATGRFRYFLDCAGSSNRLFMLISASNTLQFSQSVLSSVEIDGVLIGYGDDIKNYVDGAFHSIKLNVGDLTALDIIGARYTFNHFYNEKIKNLRITRANPTDQYPNLFFPLDDGYRADGRLRQTIPHNHKTDGTESFDMDGAVWLDYETKAAPQYVGVTGYETLAERAVLSGLSEHDEAIASCREGLVRNGDFRFGDNGDWNEGTGASFTINNNITDVVAGDQFGIYQTVYVEANTEYTISGLIKAGTGSGSIRIAKGSTLSTTIDETNSVTDSDNFQMAEVTFNSGSSTTIAVYLRAGGSLLNAYFTGIELRKVTDQQVLSPYVNHGEAINFNEGGWARE